MSTTALKAFIKALYKCQSIKIHGKPGEVPCYTRTITSFRTISTPTINVEISITFKAVISRANMLPACFGDNKNNSVI